VSEGRTGAAVAVVALAALVGLLRADPAAADPPAPSDYRSVVDAIEPAADGVDAGVVGGDAFLELTVEPGREVVVAGYQGEPYLAFRPDGTVQRNRRSPATYVNESRDGAAEPPAGTDAEAEPDWETVADGGTYAWHDHRIHWMGSGRPDGADPGEWTRPWTVDITVDGTPTRITGTLALVEGVNPLPWLTLGLAAAVAVAIAGRRRPLLAAVIAALVAAALAGGVGWSQWTDAPAGSGVSPLLVAVPLAGLVAAGLALALAPRLGRRFVTAATLAGAAAVAGWALLRLEVLWTPVLPTVLDAGLDRAGTALGLGLALAAAGLVVWGSGIALMEGEQAPALDPENEKEAGAAATVAGGDRR
jgi:hypothetical protein